MSEVTEKIGRYYPHSIEESREIRDKWMHEAKIKYPDHIHQLAEHAILHLQDVSVRGLPDCYDSFVDSLYDFYPDLPWDREGSVKAIKLILSDSRFEAICAGISNLFNFDMKAELKNALRG